MHTDTIEAETEEARSTIPMTEAPESVEVGGDLEAAVEEEQRDAPEAPAEPEADDRTAKQKIEDAERLEQIEDATAEVCDLQQQGEDAWLKATAKVKEGRDLTKFAEAIDASLKEASRRLRKLREGRFPDGAKYPMFDRDPAKEAINATFAKPESIAPLPPDTFEEALRRKQRDTMIESMGLKKGTLKALMELELTTAGKIVAKWAAVAEGGALPTTIRGITDAREEEIALALNRITAEAQAEWDAAHSEAEDAEIDAALDENAEEDEIAPDSEE